MPARDIYHDAVRNALIKDGWTITHDPFPLKWGKKDMYVDLGAERMLAAEKGGQKIAVEVKSFRSASEMRDLEQAMGQFVLYRSLLDNSNRITSFTLPYHRRLSRRCSWSHWDSSYWTRVQSA